MVLILSRNNETTTDQVIDWLIAYKIPHVRLNEEIFENFEWDFQSDLNKVLGFNIEDVKVVWFRKYSNKLNYHLSSKIINEFDVNTYSFLKKELYSIHEFLMFLLYQNPKIKWVTSPKLLTENKLIQYAKAKEFGLNIPNSFIINNKKSLLKTIDNKEFITKPTKNIMHTHINENKIMLMLTTSLKNRINNVPKKFPPSFIQERIDKNFEVRCVYLDGHFYCSKIIEPIDDLEDHRVNLMSRETRYEIFEIGNSLKEKLVKLINYFDLNFVSLDLIYDKNDVPYFLEINPVGQFTYHSFPANLYLEKKVADFISKLYNEY